MKYLEQYNYLLTMIDIYKKLYTSYETAYYAAGKILKNNSDITAISYDGMPGASHPAPPAEITLQKMLDIKYMIEEVEETLKVLYESKKRIENFIDSLEGNKNKIAYEFYIKGNEVNDIAAKLGLKEKTIRNIITEIKRESGK